MSVLVKAKHWDDSLKACDEHLVPGFQALVTNCWRLPSTAGAAGAPFCYFQASPNGSHQLCTSFASLLFHLFLGMSLWTVISWLGPWFSFLQIGRNVTDRGGCWSTQSVWKWQPWKEEVDCIMQRKTLENPQAAKILSLKFHIAIQIQDITSFPPPIAEGMKSYKNLRKWTRAKFEGVQKILSNGIERKYFEIVLKILWNSIENTFKLCWKYTGNGIVSWRLTERQTNSN